MNDRKPTARPIQVAIIGFGGAARVFHVPLIAATEGLQLVAASTSRPDGIPAGVRIAPAGSIIADPSIDLVVVTTPNDAHAQWAGRALRGGKHVVVDKPFTTDSQLARDLCALAQSTKQVLTAFHNRRWDSDYLTIKRMVGEGTLGDLRLFEAHWDRFRPEIADRWREQARPGAGLLFDLGPHMIDQAIDLFGMPEAVQCDIAAQRPGALVDDYFAMTLHFGAMRVLIGASSLAQAPRPRFQLHGTQGSFVKHGLDPQEDRLKAGMMPGEAGFGDEPEQRHGTLFRPGQPPEVVVSERGDYLAFYRGVVAAVRDGAPPPVDLADAASGIRLIEMAHVSAADGRLVRLK